MESKELLDLIQLRITQVNAWHAEVVHMSLDGLMKRGYVEPHAYIYTWFPMVNTYETTVIDIPPENMAHPDRNEETYQFLKTITARSRGEVVGFMFVSEGSKEVDGEKQSFLLLTFENMLQGRKDIYKYRKVTEIGEGGKATLVIKDAQYDHENSLKMKSAGIEKFNHIIRTNYADKTLPIHN